MLFELIRTPEAFNGLASEWNHLLAASITNVPFLRHEYARAWWATLGGGEWPAGELWIVTGRHTSGRLVGIAPLFRLQTERGPALHLLGSHEISDYLDVLVAREEVADFISGLLDYLSGQAQDAWTAVELYNLPESSPSRQELAEGAGRLGWGVEQERLQPCPVVNLAGSWEDYLQRLDKKQRHELRRKMRRADSHEAGVRLHWVDQPAEIEPAMETFLGLMRLDPQKSHFLTESMHQHFRRLAVEARDQGWLRLAFLEVGGQASAGYIYFDYADRLWIYNSCLNPAHSELSPGWVLTGRLIQRAIDDGRREADFLRGGEDYKYRLGGVARNIYRIRLERHPN